MNFIKLLDLLRSLPKTVYVNLRFLKLKDAIKLPILIHHSVKLGEMSGKIQLDEVRCAIVKIGYGGSYNLGCGGYFKCKGLMHFRGKASFAKGIQLITEKNGNLEIGDHFRCNANCIINSGKRVLIGDDVLFSWNITVIDGDGHKVIQEDVEKPEFDIIEIGNHVWVCSDVTLLKKTVICDGSIVAAKSVVGKNMQFANALVGTNTILKTNITWRE